MAPAYIILQPAQAGDFKRLAYLETSAFGDDEFTQVAFGPHRLEDRVLEARGKEMSIPNEKPGEVLKYVKAVERKEDGSEEIVGFAHWGTIRPSLGGVGVYGAFEKPGEKAIEVIEKVGEDGDNVKTVANEKLCDDLFIPGDQYMASACGGKDYHKLFTLVVDRKYHRKGIGSLLLKDGLKEADEAGLQCVLGASPEGLSLYKKHGFVEVKQMSLDLSHYEGGEGRGAVRHSILYRPSMNVSHYLRH